MKQRAMSGAWKEMPKTVRWPGLDVGRWDFGIEGWVIDGEGHLLIGKKQRKEVGALTPKTGQKSGALTV